MNIDIRKISNGYILTLNGQQTFYDVPEAICGGLAEWTLAECKRLDAFVDSAKVDLNDYNAFENAMLEQQAAAQLRVYTPNMVTLSGGGSAEG